MKLRQTLKPKQHGPPPCPCHYHRSRAKAQRKYNLRLIALGYPSGIRNPLSYLRECNRINKWHKAHRKIARKADAKYKRRVRERCGVVDSRTKDLMAIERFERKYAKRIATQNSQD